jgi:ankyrin repeat protein
LLQSESFCSGASADHRDHALHSPLHGVEYPQVQHYIALEDRQRLLSGLFGSAITPNSLQKLPHFESLLQDLVPERFEGDTENKLQHFFDPLNKCSLYQLTEFHLYFLSNNKFTEAQADNLLEFIAKQKPLGPLKSFLQMKTPTTQVFCDKILEFTIRCRGVTSLRLLIDCGIDRSTLSGTRGGKYLQIALVYAKSDIAEYLLENGVDVNPPLGEFPLSKPPLHNAVAKGYSEVVKRLIDAGANVHRECADGNTALVNGVQWGNKSIDCIRLLLEAGANVDNDKVDHLSLLDWVYLNKRKLYSMILSRSQHAKRSLTISGILYAANASRQALSQYLNSMPPIEDWRRRNKLESALCEAADYIDQPIEVVRILLEFGVDPNVETVCEESSSPLVTAAMANDIDLAELLLDAGADINAPDVLATAAENGDFDILNLFIDEGADIEAFGADALRAAGFGNNLAIVKLLLSAGADINYPAAPKGGRTLLQKAVWNGNLRTIRYLIDQGADINAPPSHSDGYTALQVAARRGHMEVVKLLLALGADINSAPSRNGGTTALEASATYKPPSARAELFQLLLDQGATINRPKAQRHYRNWSSALTILVKNSAGEDLIRSALSAGADINELGHGKGARTPVQAAAEVGSIAVVQLLLDNGANINAPPGKEYGRTALQAACSIEAPNIELVKLLLDNGADVNAPAGIKQGLTALQGAAIQGHIKIALMLLDTGVEVNAEPAAIDGRTALDGAAEHGRLDMVQLLLNLGAESEEPGATGFDEAIGLAEKHNHSAIVDLLKDHSQKD